MIDRERLLKAIEKKLLTFVEAEFEKRNGGLLKKCIHS